MPVARRPDTESPKLRAYVFHGLDLSIAGRQANGDCPFCGKDGKFTVNIDGGLYRCFVCGESGNPLVFIRELYARAYQTSDVDETWREEVAADRRLLYPDTVKAWGLCRSVTDGGSWLVPGYGEDGKLDQVYRRVQLKEHDEWVWRLLPTPGVWTEGKVHALHMPVKDFDPVRANIIVCEGPWDGMALWETWDRSGVHDTNIIAVPGCNIWRDEWTEMCRGKHVILMFDSDHHKAGYDGMARIAKRLSGVAASVRYIKWGRDGFDPTKKSGYDVRDFLSGE